jgi:hypothetical protein
MNDELQRIEINRPWPSRGLVICLEGLRKTKKLSVRIGGFLAWIRTEPLSNTSLERYLLTNLIDVLLSV